MDDRCFDLAADLVSARYIEAGRESLHATARTLRSILAQRRCPEEGLADSIIQLILRQLAMMDTNNFAAHVGGGEREGRVVSALVRERHFNFTHGIGRSGDLASEQPKAAGSSLLYKLTNVLLLDLIRLSGAPSTQAAVVVPMATGMTLALVLRCVAKARLAEVAADSRHHSEASSSSSAQPASPASCVVPKYVIWPRIDQKTALKCIDAAGLTPVVVELRPAAAPSSQSSNNDVLSCSSHFLECDVADIAAAVDAVGGPQHVVCVLSTTSCFAPRLPDNTVAIASYCKAQNIPYVVNNAYGVQSRRIMTRLDAAQRLGRVDFFVQSGDKNFLVPVGGSVVCSSSAEKCHAAAALYAGRASASPIVDLFITALSLGRRGMQALWAERYRCRARLVELLRVFAQERGELLLVDDTDNAVSGPEGSCAKEGTGADGDGAQQSTSGQEVGKTHMKKNNKTNHNRKKRSAAASAAPSRNDISLAVTMRYFARPSTVRHDNARGAAEGNADAPNHMNAEDKARSCGVSAAATDTNWAAAKAFGAQLFRSAVTGPRVIVPAPMSATTIAGCTFHNYGMHQDGQPPCPMLVIACGVGMTMDEVEALVRRLRELWPAGEPLDGRAGRNSSSNTNSS